MHSFSYGAHSVSPEWDIHQVSGQETLVLQRAERKVTLSNSGRETSLFHQVSGHPSWSVFSWSLRSCPPPGLDRPVTVTAEVRAQCLIRPLRISLAQGCGQMQTKHRNAAETSALALLSNHECICNLNRQPVGNENNSMESAVDAQEWQSRGMSEMETHDWVTSSTQYRNGKVLKGQFTHPKWKLYSPSCCSKTGFQSSVDHEKSRLNKMVLQVQWIGAWSSS